MRQELIEKLKELLTTEDISSIKQEVRQIRSDFKAETAKEKQLQLEKWNELEHEEGDEFEFNEGEQPAAFNELLGQYSERVKEHGQKIAEEQKANLAAKNMILIRLKSLVQNEENIGKAFNDFNEIQEEWKGIGDVPGDKYEEVQSDYNKLKEQFFYNINIYKALQENDLKVNLTKKEALIARVKELEGETSVRNLEITIRQLQREWQDVGPSPRETYQELGDTFFGEIRKNYDKIQAHYDAIKGDMAENLAKKKALVNEVKQLLDLEITHHQTWVKKTDEIKVLQENWKKVGYAAKKENEEVWQEFRGLCDLFFEKKKAFYDGRKEVFKTAQAKKEALLAKAKELQESKDWKSTTQEFIKLQDEWKKAGTTFQREEQKLWQKFRAACDTYFNAKKDHFKDQDAAQAQNLDEKKKLLEDIKNYELTNNVQEDVKVLKEFSIKWNSIGFVPRKNVQEVGDVYKALLDEKYKALNVAREDASVSNYEARVEMLKNAPDGENQVRREKRLLRDKIDRLQKRANQYENNLGFFGHSAGAQALKKDVEKKVEQAQREIREIKKKLRLLS